MKSPIKKFHYWLLWCKNQKYNYKWKRKYLITNFLITLISLIVLIYSTKSEKLFGELNPILLYVSIIFLIYGLYKLLKEFPNWYKRQINLIKILLIILLIIISWQAYIHQDTILKPIYNFYDKSNFSIFTPIFTNNSGLSDISTLITGPKIDDAWVHNFMAIVNDARVSKGLQVMNEENYLNKVAKSRFNKMMENPFISHYGAEEYNVGEVVFYPKTSEQSYIKDIQETAPLHWDLLMSPLFTTYGYYIEEGPVIEIYGSCSTTEIPGPNINVKEFFKEKGCAVSVGKSMWLVIDMT
ncbi:MAG TPA: hypothetical protein P5277_02505 [Candidatus Paceibacterota bacterium]|nr:hypothetical protein [Candidatus Paceibacterota bacterium]